MHRLIGAAILVLAGVIGFPLFFDNQPRPISVDLPILIPDKTKVPALVVPPPPTPATGAGPAPAVVPAPVPVAQAPAVLPPVEAAAPAPAASPKPVVTAPAAPDVSATKAADAGKARDLLEGREPEAKAAAADSRFIVQVGAFSDAEKVREVRRKVEGLGLKTYTQVVETKDGSRIRVRVGPFADKAEATRAADKIRKLDLSASILSL